MHLGEYVPTHPVQHLPFTYIWTSCTFIITHLLGTAITVPWWVWACTCNLVEVGWYVGMHGCDRARWATPIQCKAEGPCPLAVGRSGIFEDGLGTLWINYTPIHTLTCKEMFIIFTEVAQWFGQVGGAWHGAMTQGPVAGIQCQHLQLTLTK